MAYEPNRLEPVAPGTQTVPRDFMSPGRKKVDRPVPNALPQWALPPLETEEPEAGGEEGAFAPLFPGPTVPGRTGVGEEDGRELGPGAAVAENLPDVYRRMLAETQPGEPSSVPGMGQGGPGNIDMAGEPEQDQVADGIGAKLLEYNSFVGSRKSSLNDYMAQGESLLKQGGYYSAARAYDRAMSIEPDNPLVYLGRAHSLLGAGDLVSASDDLSMALEMFPKVGGRRINLPEFYYSQEEFDRIVQKLQQRIEVRQKDARVRLLLGYMYIYSGEVPLGTAALQEAVELAGEDPEVSDEWAKVVAEFAREVPKQESGGFMP